MLLKDVKLTKEQVYEQTKKYMIETYERFPFVASRAKDMYLYDENDVAYLDFYGGIAVNSAGSCNEKVVAAVREQVGQIMHTFNYPYTVPQTALAKLICDTIEMDKIFFQNSGTESNEAMIKMARKYGVDNHGPNKYHIITAKMGFHGRSYGALSATGQPDNACQLGFKPVLPGFTYADYNDLESFKAAVTDDTIAIMLEPIQGEGGVIPGTEAFFKGIRQLCDEKGLLLLIDEIQTGWYRTGPAMAYMRFGIKPDAVSMAKAMGGGMPIGAVCATAKLATAFNPGSLGTPYGGNPVCCAAAYAQISDMIERKVGENAASVGAYFADQLRKLPHVTEVRGEGLLVGVVFDIPRAVDIKHGCLDRRLLVTAIGQNIIRMVPPLIATKEDCDKATEIIKQSVDAL
jgi:acetylornithine/N-succinyldiaminopimelate aminotransferase